MSKTPSKQSVLALAALGIVYGDIGTSPLYAFRECFNGKHATTLNPDNVMGILSLIFWLLILIVSVKYLFVVLKADHHGEGGVLALMQSALTSLGDKRLGKTFILLIGLFGAALLYGDGLLTPAISVLSAVEGLKVINPAFENLAPPLTTLILVVLFLGQQFGTAKVGMLFGPVMLLWFSILGVLGVVHILKYPDILVALNPVLAIKFLSVEGFESLYVLGAVFLVVTGGEALYADLGHFGKKAIRQAWFFVVLPGLVLNYFGQGALLIRA
ncbi:KUP/HAK/KT family potassium transporter, partial [Limibacter armeniacum]